jgi:hypothetical protein
VPDSVPLIAAIKQGWLAGGFAWKEYFTDTFNADPPAQTARPYLVFTITSEAADFFSNASQYDMGSFDVAIVADTLEDFAVPSSGQKKLGAGDSLVSLVETAIKNMATILTTAGFKVGKFRPGTCRYEQQDHWWKVTQTWNWTATKAK